jgi:hypothetical protein
MPQKFWRTRSRPVVQISIPFYFVCDEVCYLNQLPPFLSETHQKNFPGIFISGRFPTHIWPRSLNFAFEWQDAKRDLILTRGEPISYLMFETLRPFAPINLVEAVETDELRDYRALFEDLPNFTSQTFSFMSAIEAKHPSALLQRV